MRFDYWTSRRSILKEKDFEFANLGVVDHVWWATLEVWMWVIANMIASGTRKKVKIGWVEYYIMQQ